MKSEEKTFFLSLYETMMQTHQDFHAQLWSPYTGL